MVLGNCLPWTAILLLSIALIIGKHKLQKKQHGEKKNTGDTLIPRKADNTSVILWITFPLLVLILPRMILEMLDFFNPLLILISEEYYIFRFCSHISSIVGCFWPGVVILCAILWSCLTDVNGPIESTTKAPPLI